MFGVQFRILVSFKRAATKMRHRLAQILLRGGGLWLIGALAIAIPISRINLVRFYRLNREGIHTNGVVTNLQPANHQSVNYSFSVGGKHYSSIGRAGFGNPEFCCLTVGQNLIVYYLPSDPRISCAGIPEQLIQNEVPPIVLAGIIFPLFAMVVYSWHLPRFRRWILCEGQTSSGG